MFYSKNRANKFISILCVFVAACGKVQEPNVSASEIVMTPAPAPAVAPARLTPEELLYQINVMLIPEMMNIVVDHSKGNITDSALENLLSIIKKYGNIIPHDWQKINDSLFVDKNVSVAGDKLGVWMLENDGDNSSYKMLIELNCKTRLIANKASIDYDQKMAEGEPSGNITFNSEIGLGEPKAFEEGSFFSKIYEMYCK